MASRRDTTDDTRCEIARLNTHYLNLYKCMAEQIKSNDKDEKQKSGIKNNNPNFLFLNSIYTSLNFLIEGVAGESKKEMENENNNNNNNNNDNNDNNDNINLCRNVYGFCLSYYNGNNELRKLIHNYGCIHLQLNMPLIIRNAISKANENNQQEIFLSSIRLEFQIFSNFLHKLKNI